MASKRFRIPKRFKNTDMAAFHPTPLMKVYHGPSNPQDVSTVIAPQPAQEINEIPANKGNLPRDYTFYNSILLNNAIWGKSYTRMSYLGDINLFKPTVMAPSGNNAYTYSIGL